MNSGNPPGGRAAPTDAGDAPFIEAGETTDFGFQTVGRAQKKARVREVFDSVAGKYDIMNDLMSLGVHRLWKRDFIAALEPRPNRRLLDLAGGTGDISFGWLKRGGGPAILSDINAQMLGVGAGPRHSRRFSQ